MSETLAQNLLSGLWYLLAGNRATGKKRAESAEQRAANLAERLRAMGIDPESIE